MESSTTPDTHSAPIGVSSQYSVAQTERSFMVARQENAPENPLVSVVVPVFNAVSTLDQALTSLTEQTLENIEIVCVNDTSTDASPEILQQFFAADARFTIVNHAANAGYGASMNDGIHVARGTWIAILEPDDYVRTNMYERMLDFADDYEGIEIIKTPYIREMRDEGTKRGEEPRELLNCSYHKRIKPAHQPFSLHDAHTDHLLRHHPSIWSALYRKSFLEENDIHFVEYPGSGWADNEFFFETLLAASHIVYLDEPFYIYREETPQEASTFLRMNNRLPFDRWHSMDAIVKKRGFANDTKVRLAHTAKGFTFLHNQIAANTNEQGILDTAIAEEMERMFAAMDPELVANERSIAPYLRELYNDYLHEHGIDAKDPSTLSYYHTLLNEFGYTLRNNGWRYTFGNIKKTLGK